MTTQEPIPVVHSALFRNAQRLVANSKHEAKETYPQYAVQFFTGTSAMQPGRVQVCRGNQPVTVDTDNGDACSCYICRTTILPMRAKLLAEGYTQEYLEVNNAWPFCKYPYIIVGLMVRQPWKFRSQRPEPMNVKPGVYVPREMRERQQVAA